MRKESLFDNSDATKKELYAELIGRVGIITPDGYPRIIPVNFVELNNYIYFHGAISGEKYDVFLTNPKVTFEIDKPYSSIPSYWLGDKNGCAASIFFKSLLIRGTGTIVDDLQEKADSLEALMQKDQPEGQYHTISLDNPLYKKPLQETGIYRIEVLEITMKNKLGQNRSEKVRKMLIEKLRNRGSQLDLSTALEIEKTLINK